MAAIALVTIFSFAFAIIRPCMPPVVTSAIYLECQSWDDDGETGFLFRILAAIVPIYLSALLANVVVFTITVALMYPTLVKLIILKSMDRLQKDNHCKYAKTYKNLLNLLTRLTKRHSLPV